MRHPELDEKTFDLLVTIHAKRDYAIHVDPERIDEFFLMVEELCAPGFVTIQKHFKIGREHTYDLRITSRGRQYVVDTDPVVLTRVFAKNRFINYAAYWLQKYLTFEQLPEFLVHEDPFIRKAAEEKYTCNCSELVFPCEQFNTRAHCTVSTIPPLYR